MNPRRARRKTRERAVPMPKEGRHDQIARAKRAPAPPDHRRERSDHQPQRRAVSARCVVIPAAFDYQAPTSVEVALQLLAEGGDDAKIIAGGQSLLPVLKLRLAAPELVIDLAKIDSLKGVRDDGDAIVIGAMTPHFEVVADPLVNAHASLIAKCAATVADPQVRHRGTFGGACAHADPASDIPAPTLALDAEFVIAGPGGQRRVAAADFFQDLFTTAMGDD